MKHLSKGGYTFLFFIMGCVFLIIEVTMRAVTGKLVGVIPNISFASFIGYTSLWMIPVGGLIGIVLGLLNETNHKLSPLTQTLLGTIFVVAVELLSGLLLNKVFNLNLWDYTYLKFNFLGQISLLHSFIWLLICPTAFWLDDQIKYYLFGLTEKYSLVESYKRLFN